MSQSEKNQKSHDDEVLFDASSLDSVPSTEGLQARILKATYDLPQQSSVEVIASSHSYSLMKKTLPFALAAGMALCALLVLPNFSNQNAIERSVAVNELSVDELDYQEAMLLYDELMFAQL